MIKMDLKKFKHMKSDDKSTTLQHQDGHILTIAHKSLNPKMQEQLKALADASKMAETPLQQDETDHKMAKGGKLKNNPNNPFVESKMADGGYASAKRSGALGTGPKIEQESEDTKAKPAPRETTTLTGSEAADSPKQKSAQEAFSKHMKSQPEVKEPEVETQMAKGGNVKRKMYADSEDVISKNDEAPINPQSYPEGHVPQTQEATPEEVKTPVISPDMQRTREIYDRLIQPPPDAFSMAKGVPEQEPSTKTFQGSKGNPIEFSPDTYVEAERRQAEEKAQNSARETQIQKNVIDENLIRAKAGLPLLPVPTIPSGPTPPGMEPTAGLAPTPAQTQPQAPISALGTEIQTSKGGIDFTNPMGEYQRGVQEHLGGIYGQAGAQAQFGKEREAALAASQKEQERIKTDYQTHYDALESERQNLIHDIQNGYVDPKKYWQDHSKIASGIGMILAGFNPTNNPDAAVNFLKFQMEQNLEAQKANLASKNNLLAHNLQQFGNLKSATEMTRIMQTDLMANQLEQAAARAASPLAKAQAAQAAGQLRQTIPAQQAQIAMRQAIMSMNTADQGAYNPDAVNARINTLRLMNQNEIAKDLEQKHVVGVGVAKYPVPDKDRQRIQAYNNVANLLNEAQQMAKTPYTSMSLEQRRRGQTLLNELQSQIRTAEDQGVYKESEANFMKETIGANPASAFASINSLPQLKEMTKLKDNEYKNLMSTYGLKPQSPFKTEQSQPQYKTVKGVTYMRGPKGEAIPVK